MTRSAFAITRLIILPYLTLLILYLLVIGGGGAWLYLHVRTVESRLVIDELLELLEPLAEKLSSVDAISLMDDGGSWLHSDVKGLFAALEPLREFSVRSHNGGYKTSRTDGEITSQSAAPLTQGLPLESTQEPVAERLHTESEPLFVIGFELASEDDPPVRLDFGFDRPALLARVDEGLFSIRHAIMWFGIAGGISILVALGITVFAMRTTRRVEGYFQDIYRRASLTEMAAELVHDLRNPLMALRTNVKALLVSPEETREIVADLDRDILILNDKLSGFLKLTRSHDEGFLPTDIEALIYDTARLAKPILQQHGLGIDLHIAANLPKPPLQEAAIRDALLNVIVNAGESGQTSGAVRITATGENDAVTIVVEDRGKGIAKEDMARLFDAFYTTKPDGSGLGLAIVRRIVEVHHGCVHAESLAQGGTRITITLPLQQQEIPHWWKALKKTSPT